MPGRLLRSGLLGLRSGSAFPQESLNLLGCERGFEGVTAKLLVVDDEPRMAETTAAILRRAGYSVDVAGGGTEALERVRINSPDLLLLDYEMPDMEVPAVLDLLRDGVTRVPVSVILPTGGHRAQCDQVRRV